MSKKKPAQFKRFSDAMSKIVRVSKDELARRELVDKQQRLSKKSSFAQTDDASVALDAPQKPAAQ